VSQFKLSRGARPLLFERLCENVASVSDGSAQVASRFLNEEQLRASVARELSDLLNTRVPVPITILEARARTAIDYGIPDFSAFPLGEHDAARRLVRHIRESIMVYEPRIREPIVELARSSMSAAMIEVVVRGGLELGMMRAPVEFRFLLGDAPGGDGV
jgi:type VI secretion system protein ImpF